MATPSVDELMTEMTEDEVLRIILSLASMLGLPVTSWFTFGVARTICVIVSKVVAPFTIVLVQITRGGFLDTATGVWLKLLAYYYYAVLAEEASAATGELTITSATGESTDYAIGELTFAHATTGKTYRNSVEVTIPPSGDVTFAIVADESGTGSNAAANAITVCVNGINGITVTNDDILLGEDEEDEDSIRTRCRLRLASLSPNGPAQAFEYVALTRSLNGDIPVNRVKVVPNSATGQITVYLAKASGALITPDETLPVHNAMVQWALPLCMTLTTQSAVENVIDVTYTAYVDTDESLTADEVKALIADALATYFSTLKIGGIVLTSPPGKTFKNAIEGEIKKAAPLLTVTVTAPAADVTIASNEVPKLGSLAASTVTLVDA